MKYLNKSTATHKNWNIFKSEIDAIPLELWGIEEVSIWSHNLICHTHYEFDQVTYEKERLIRIWGDERYAEKRRETKNSPEKLYESRARRSYAMKVSTPSWADKSEIRRIYRERNALTKATGIKHEVDHIIPLVGKNEHGEHVVCGLHVEHNLRVITKRENASKNCRYKG